MTSQFFTHFLSVFSRNKPKVRSDLLTLAKIEYGNDWEWAYNHLLTSNGQLPQHGVKL